MSWLITGRILFGSIDSLITGYAFIRAFWWHGSNRYMRLTLAVLAGAFTYGQFSLAANPLPFTGRTLVGWVASGLALCFLGAALRADHQDQNRSIEGAP